MATTRRTRFSRRIPDHVTDELVNVLSEPKTYEFNSLFELVYENLKERNAVSGGEEMLRLRAYEKLQNLVTRGLVEKAGKKYRGLERIERLQASTLLRSKRLPNNSNQADRGVWADYQGSAPKRAKLAHKVLRNPGHNAPGFFFPWVHVGRP